MGPCQLACPWISVPVKTHPNVAPPLPLRLGADHPFSARPSHSCVEDKGVLLSVTLSEDRPSDTTLWIPQGAFESSICHGEIYSTLGSGLTVPLRSSSSPLEGNTLKMLDHTSFPSSELRVCVSARLCVFAL